MRAIQEGKLCQLERRAAVRVEERERQLRHVVAVRASMTEEVREAHF